MIWVWAVGLFVVFVLGLSFYGSLETTKIPYLAVPYTPRDFGWTYEDVSFPAEDGLRLTGWFVPAPEPSPVTLIIQHGMGSNAGDMLLNTLCLQREGRWNLFYYNFRGHADSEGEITSLGPLELGDMRAALKFIKSYRPEATRRLGVYGHSLGAAVALVGAASFPELEAVVAESSFASISLTVRRFAKIYHGLPYFPFVPLSLFFTSLRLGMRIGRFSPVEAIGKIAPRPVLLIQAGRDLRTPMADFQSLWSAAREPKEQWLVPEADHGDPILVNKEAFDKHLVEFFRKVFA